MICLTRILSFLFVALCSGTLWAYPEFIGYGYSSCISCHYNGNGSGPLTDYGRALWSTEIASRALFPSSVSGDDLGSMSGFLGSYELPPWLRPHAKYRGLELITNPGGVSQGPKYYQMQADLGLTLKDKLDKYVAVMTWGKVVDPAAYGAGTSLTDRILAREYYLRVALAETWWVYAGLLEKVFGIRNIDHTSFQRSPQGFGVRPNNRDGMAQSHGVVVQKIEENWEVAANYFIGNPYDDPQFKQHGVSITGEYEIAENKRLGASLLSSKNDLLSKDLVALHYRQSLSHGSALLFEWGLIQDLTPDATTVGSYNLLQALIAISRGYNFKTTVERYNSEFNSSHPEQWKWSAGILAFPLPRLELRAEFINQRAFSNQGATDDSWALQGQVHVSL
jgi:hypothetical protein